MRFVRVLLTPGEQGFAPGEHALASDPSVTPRAVHHVNVLDDGTAFLLEEYGGDAVRAEEIVREQPDILAFDISPTDDGFFIYTRLRLTGAVADLLGLLQEHETIAETPMAFTREGALRVQFIGEEEALRAVLSELPDEVDIDVERIGTHDPDSEGLFSLLTERQREVLELAMRCGYYETPRRATHGDIARELDVSAETVGEHLRKAESSVLSTVLPGGGPNTSG